MMEPLEKDFTSMASPVIESLKKHEEDFLEPDQKNLTLILGNVGCGKSTLTLFLTGAALNARKNGEKVIIVDENDQIGIDVESKTIIPQLMTEIMGTKANKDTKTTKNTKSNEVTKDAMKNVSYYDCPGFLDDRDLDQQITVAYFLNKVLTHATSLKLVFVIDYDSVTDTANFGAFMILMYHALRVIVDFEKFKNGIAMIVTSVGHSTGSDYIEDNEALEKVGTFLSNMKDMLSESNEDPDIEPEVERFNDEAIKFIDILSIQKDNEYQRIGLFRKPIVTQDMKGDESWTYIDQKAQENLKKLIHENIEYVPIMSHVFGYSISAEERTQATELLPELIENQLMVYVSKICDQLDNHYHNLLPEKSADLSAMHEELKKAQKILSEIELNRFAPETLMQLIDAANGLGIALAPEDMKRIPILIECINFLNELSEQEAIDGQELAKRVTVTIDQIDSSQKWYRFLIHLHKELGEAYSRRDNVKDLVDEICKRIPQKANEPENVKNIDLNSLVAHINFQGYEDIENLEIKPSELRALRSVLKDAFRDFEISFMEENKKKLTVKGWNVKISDVINDVNWLEAEVIEIFALNTVIIDADIDRTGMETKLTIIAPKWITCGVRKIILDGKDGESHNQSSAEDGRGTVGNPGNGAVGRPGLPGGPAGSFIGIGIRCDSIDWHQLEVSANGGKGGPGQDGGKGTDGIDGQLPIVTDDDISKWLKRWESEGYTVSNPEKRIYVIDAKDITKPGNGGNGGAGGLPGKCGQVCLIDLRGTENIGFSPSDGKTGQNGRGGPGGNGPIANNKLKVNFRNLEDFRIIEGDKHPSGKSGDDGENKIDQIEPVAVRKFEHPSVQINEYKTFVWEHLANKECIRVSELRDFVTKLDKHNEVHELYDTLGLVNELECLEKQFTKYRNDLSFEPFLQSLLKRIETFTKQIPKDDYQQKKVLIFLYSATLSKLQCVRRNKAGKYTVVDLDNFLEETCDEIESMKKIESRMAVDEHRKNYYEALKKKMTAANEFIEKGIKPEIEAIYDQIDNEIDELINETMDLQAGIEEQQETSRNNMRELQSNMVLRMTLSSVKMVGSILGIFGPIAPIGAAISGVASIAENLAIDDAANQGAIISPSSAIAGVNDEIIRLMSSRRRAISNAIINIDKDLGKLRPVADQNIQNVLNEYNRFKESVKQLEADTSVGDKVAMEKLNKQKDDLQDKTKELLLQLEDKKNELSVAEFDIQREIDQQIDHFGYVNSVLTTIDYGVEFYNKYQNDKTAIKNAATAADGLEKEMNMMRLYEQHIYDLMTPKLRQMQKLIENTTKHLDGKFHAELDIGRWEMQTALRDLTVIFKRMTMGFRMQIDLLRCIEKLEEGLITLTDIYDRIDSYSGEANLAAYLADLSTASSHKIIVDDRELAAAITRLKLIIKTNLAMERYELAMHACKQRSFPLAHEFDLTEVLEENTNFEAMINDSLERIKDLRLKIKSSESLLLNYDIYIHPNAEFDSHDENAKHSFYIWKYESIKKEMKQLLGGEQILLKADIANGLAFNAIKFKEIRIYLSIANKAAQEALDDKLSGFYVNLTMMGNQYYRCGNKCYYVPLDENIEMKYKFDPTEGIIDPNLVYEKIRKNEPFLSPYTTWAIQLDEGNIGELAKFVGKPINLELIGKGSYCAQDILQYCDSNLEKYYNLDVGCLNGKNVYFERTY